MTRSESREQAFVLVFEKIFNPELSVSEIVEAAEISDDVQYPDEFAVRLAETVFEHISDADSVIEKYAKGWKLQRLSKVSLAVLRLAVCEILYCDDVPDSVTINEAVELSKKYSTVKDSSFVNGILGSLVRSDDR